MRAQLYGCELLRYGLNAGADCTASRLHRTFRVDLGRARNLDKIKITLLQHQIDHPLKAHLHSIFRRKYFSNAIRLEFCDFLRHDDTAAASKYPDMAGSLFLEQVIHVFEILDVPPLIGRDGDSLNVLLNRRLNHFSYRPVMTEVDYFCATRLQDATHYVNCRVVSIEQAGGGDEANGIDGFVYWCRHVKALLFPYQVYHQIFLRFCTTQGENDTLHPFVWYRDVTSLTGHLQDRISRHD